MKDKLTKTGHKKLYYRLKATLAVFLFVVAVAGAAMLPIAISYQVADQAKAKDDTSNGVNQSEMSESSTSLVVFLSAE
jgi:hypothetical protein